MFVDITSDGEINCPFIYLHCCECSYNFYNLLLCITDPDMPEHDLEPPRFSRRALERILNDWTAVKSMLQDGCKEKETPPTCRNEMLYEDQVYLACQNGTMRLDKFTHCLLVKCSVEVRVQSFMKPSARR